MAVRHHHRQRAELNCMLAVQMILKFPWIPTTLFRPLNNFDVHIYITISKSKIPSSISQAPGMSLFPDRRRRQIKKETDTN